jgi:hypothetical protein
MDQDHIMYVPIFELDDNIPNMKTIPLSPNRMSRSTNLQKINNQVIKRNNDI